MTLFERIAAGELPASFVHRDEHCMAFMDIHPMSPGHVLVCPLAGAARLNQLDEALRGHLWSVAQRVAAAQRAALGSRAQHFLLNDGPGASQSVPHVHIHVIPRYRGDGLLALARIIAHVGILALPLPVGPGKRRRLEAQAERLRRAMDDVAD